MDQLQIAKLHRMGNSSQQERYSVDFVVNDQSLFHLLGADRLDMCGSFWRDLPEINAQAEEVFTGLSPSELEKWTYQVVRMSRVWRYRVWSNYDEGHLQ